ncbi:MAG: hypothetical protein QM486_07645 [Flavobacteriaceae bacterium]
MKRKLKYLVVIFFITQFSQAQCAMCKAVVESGDSSFAEGINNGILYLMAMPYLLLFVVAFLYYKGSFKKKI